MAYDAEAFAKAGTPGRGSDVGDFVPGKKGGWVPRNHPDAMSDTMAPGIVTGGDDVAAPGMGAVGANAGEAGPAGPAMAGLRAASAGSGGGVGTQQIAPPDASNPMLGQRIYPVAMRQLAMLAPRVY